MPTPARFEARFDIGLGDIRVSGSDGSTLTDADAVCLGAMVGEVLDEMDRCGFDPHSAHFTIARRPDGEGAPVR
ncbi:hypothetical protein N825_12720 [Skermanella stibiiresistens SB22]|uniref:Uncharacterized protein n=1 Tax=Skermanella stibiiresistens SB22 TaxID=1385369 RepID=W9GY04_9PROT|nr:hypothetical protein [Skermanella stibiiresistens]EWY38669.1 hypothetical protein N825_12720 [Skermanella stibiiresistens SB22]